MIARIIRHILPTDHLAQVFPKPVLQYAKGNIFLVTALINTIVGFPGMIAVRQTAFLLEISKLETYLRNY
jgi:hypothetical protein